MIKRAMAFAAAGFAAAVVSTAASAHVGVGVYLGAPVYVAPPPVVYAPPPPVVYAPPPPVYYGGYGGYGGYRRGYWGGGPRWHDHGRHRGWEGRHGHGRW
ncbi:hypothetical protein [Burkholderia sp. Ac-20365]|jgi:hypothetical protein|uniref:hypothetical protein n=1 Tax=Burkholderia sp. Ac-20365 TaxID=2703897 RepID=UPI00197C615D|nr:hypothetical protein [Burkholderia sp. Ac-20365]MBN3764285.1 hypothetical protein [Burkholderia sp. Ac-20365]